MFSICAIAPTSCKPEFNTRSVSASNVIIYFIFGSLFSLFIFQSFIVLTLKTFFILPKRYSLNWFNSPLFLSHPKKCSSFPFHCLFLYIKLKIGSPSFLYLLFNSFKVISAFSIIFSSYGSFLFFDVVQSPNSVK